MSGNTTVLVIDDEIRSLEAIRRVLAEEFEVISVRGAEEAEEVLAGEMVQVILCDQRMPGENGVDFLKRVRDQWPDPVRMIISGYSDSEDIIAGVNEAGIYHYITKPWHPERLIDSVREAARLYWLQRETGAPEVAETKPSQKRLSKQVIDRRRAERQFWEFDRIVHQPVSPMAAAIGLAKRATDYDISVLITGASGTGKELLARAIHNGSARADQPFVVENCGALPDDLLESELFGCKKGAFTGAYQDRIGLFEVADGGTIFLDEIGDMALATQTKILRVLQQGEIQRVGGTETLRVDVRILAATNKDLEAMVKAKTFREDLYYRLNVVRIRIPALRERTDDIPQIVDFCLQNLVKQRKARVGKVSPEAMAVLVRHRWPGNVRELENVIYRSAVIAQGDAILVKDLPAELGRSEEHTSELQSH